MSKLHDNVHIKGELRINDFLLPLADGMAGQVLMTDGSGTTTFNTIGGGAGAFSELSATQITPSNVNGNVITTAPNSTIAGGQTNTIDGANSFIGAGQDNMVVGVSSVIVGGTDNDASGANSFIGAGSFNVTDVSSTHSTILGGHDNNTGGFDNVHLIGSNLLATADDTTYVENLDISGEVSMTNGAFLPNQSAPATPTGGGILFVENGSLKFIGSGGTTTIIANA